jgi:hypothetical protein
MEESSPSLSSAETKTSRASAVLRSFSRAVTKDMATEFYNGEHRRRAGDQIVAIAMLTSVMPKAPGTSVHIKEYGSQFLLSAIHGGHKSQ